MKLIIEGYNKSIHKKDNQIIIKEDNKEKDNILASKITDITILGKGYITFDALKLLAQNNTKLVVVNYQGKIEYILESPENQNNLKLKKQQYKASEDTRSITIAKEIIKAKIKNQKATLTTLNKNKKNPQIKEKTEKLEQYIQQLETIKEDTQNITKTKEKILGIEGKSSNEYWTSIKQILPPELNFQNRTKKPAHDIVNAMLNYGYAILASEITKNILLTGLDPYCGFLHYDLKNRTSLTYDLIEEYRQQIVDKTILSIINNKQITTQDYNTEENSLTLEKRKLIINKIMKKLNTQLTYKKQDTTYKEIIENQTKNLTQYLQENKEYKAFYLRW